MNTASQVKTDNSIETITASLIYLSECCDGASNKDGWGFNKTDSAFGKSLADKVKAGLQLSESQLLAALKMIKKYEITQLNPVGLILPDIQTIKNAIAAKATDVEPDKKSIEMYNDKLRVYFPYNTSLVNIVKNIKGGRYVRAIGGEQNYWEFELRLLTEILTTLSPFNFKLDRKIIDELEAQKQIEYEKQREIKSRIDWCRKYYRSEYTNWKFKAFDHQWYGAKFIISQYNLRGVIADTQGLGKTITALMAAKAIREWYLETGESNNDVAIIVLSPVSIKLNWIKEAKKLKMRIEVFGYATIPEPLEYKKYIVIADECHYLQNIKSQRTKKALEFTSHENCISFIGLSGTPMKNGRPSNLYPLLKIVGHPIADYRKEYEKKYCDAKPTRFTKWDTTGVSNLEELNEKIKDKVLRRTKDECLDLPDKIFAEIICEKDSESEREYQDNLVELKRKYQERVDSGQISNNGEAIVFLGYFRRLASIYKIKQTIDSTEELLEQGEPVIIFTDFVESAERIAKHFGVTALTGAIDSKKRQELVDEFQDGTANVFVGTIKSCGVGITLTRGCYTIMHDFTWNLDYEQATDRQHRIGQTRKVTIYDVYGKDIDYVMAGIQKDKQENVSKVLHKMGIKLEDKNKANFYTDLLKKLMK